VSLASFKHVDLLLRTKHSYFCLGRNRNHVTVLICRRFVRASTTLGRTTFCEEFGTVHGSFRCLRTDTQKLQAVVIMALGRALPGDQAMYTLILSSLEVLNLMPRTYFLLRFSSSQIHKTYPHLNLRKLRLVNKQIMKKWKKKVKNKCVVPGSNG